MHDVALRGRWRIWLLVGVGLAGCVAPEFVPCDDGTVCAAGRVCIPGGGCAAPAAVEACFGLAEGDVCSLPDFGSGRCRGGVCRDAACGDGVVDPNEACDDGNSQDNDGCSRDCRSDETCGNGVRDALEECDLGADPLLGNSDEPDRACRTNCQRQGCGDGVADTASAGEGCDAGAENSGAPDAACRPDCEPRRCGDGVRDPVDGEVCDDGNLAVGDGCTPDCRSDETCGNGVLDYVTGEACDDGLASHDGCSSQCTRERPTWSFVASTVELAPPKLYDTRVVYDPAGQRLLLFGGQQNVGNDEDPVFVTLDDTWEYRNDRWTLLAPATRPSPRSGHTMVFDSARARVLLFGGADPDNAAWRNDTWSFDGSTWTELATATRPTKRLRPAMGYDAARDRVVLYGGFTAPVECAPGRYSCDDTWEFDGADWTLASAARGASPLEYPRGGVDAAGRLVVVGRDASTYQTTGTWRWDGTSWEEIVAAAATPNDNLAYRLLYYDAAAEVLTLSTGARSWALVNAAWQERPAPEGPPPVLDAQLIYAPDRQRLLAYDSEPAGYPVQLSASDGLRWMPLSTPPRSRSGPAMAFDSRRGRSLLFGGVQPKPGGSLARADTWELGSRWEPRFPAHAPAGRSAHAVAYHAASARIVLFGGADGANARLGDTWVWDGDDWAQLAPSAAPSARRGHAMTSTDAGVLLFGGDDGALRDDTWRFDGTTWSDVSGVSRPPARRDAAIAHDDRRGVTVLFGGHSAVARLGDTWAFVDGAWAPRPVTVSPSQRGNHGMVFDPALGKIVLFGGDVGTEAYVSLGNDLWVLDAATWTRAPLESVPGRVDSAFAYDAIRQGLVIFGDYPTAYGYAGMTMAIATGDVAVPDESCLAAAVDADDDGLAGCDDPDCWGRCAPFCPPATSCDPMAPACGDAVCDAPREDPAICPGDCPA